MAVGRISGPLLKDNLLRDGVNLAFETDLLFLDVINGRVGIKTATPTNELSVNGTTRTTNLEVVTQATVANFTISGSTIASSSGTITLVPSGANPAIYQSKILVNSNLQLSTNTIETTVNNTDINISTLGTGQLIVNANTLINGNLHATGTITADGNITLGDANTDNIIFNADVASNIIPDITNTYSLGSNPGTSGKEWANLYARNIYATTINTTSLLVNGINLVLPQGNIIYVSTTGSNSNAGVHENNPVLTIKYALSLATSGTTVYVYPGTYTEIFPLTIPVGVVLKGAGIRAVTIQPTGGTVTNDAVLLNGETTVEDLTLIGFRFNSGANTGYGFRFATNITVTTRSPYIRNVTVITRGSTTSGSDPYGFDSNDAGKGVLADGSVANASSKEAAMLFHNVTFFTPNQECVSATNGTRIEWLNSFSYFADKGFALSSGSTGFAGAGQTRLHINSRVGTWNVGNTVTYYDTDGTTVLASGTVASIDATNNYVNLTGKQIGFETITDRTSKTVFAQGNAKLSTSFKKFGTASLALDGTGDYLSVASQPDFAFPSTISRIAKTITANGNAAVSATQSKFGGSSIAFDGTGDYLSIASDTDYGFGTGDFTIEGWFYKTAVATQYLFDTRTTLNENSIAVQSNGSGSLRLFVNGAFVLTSSNAHTNNAWNHLAISRASGVTRFFINGVVSTTTYTDATNYGTTKPLVVGSQYNGTTAFAGYIDDFRVSNTARYTTTFTPTTTAFVDDVDTKLLVNGNLSIADNVGGTATDFTLEAWIYPTVTTYHSIFDFRSVSTEAAIYLGINLSDQIYLYVNGVVPITTAAISLNVWTHVAVVRYNSITKIYVNGTQSGASWTDITNYGTTKPLRIGAWYNNLYGFLGYIDDVRISKGIARYTTTFTAPTTALTGDNDTVLLLHFNGTNNSTTILDDGITFQDLRTSAGGTATLIDFADYSDFGVEVRSIGSACVYGNYGVVGDGDGVIAYLISSNLAYVGAGKKSTNDPTDRIQANEIVETNRAKIYFTSVDNEGNFRVGDNFYINQQTGDVTFNNQNLSVNSILGVTITDGTNTTTLLSTEINTGNIRISGNTVESLTGPLNVVAANGIINLQNNTYVTGNLDVTGNVTIGGNITIGDANTDSINFIAAIASNLIPSPTATYNLGQGGATPLRWNNAYLSRAEIDGLVIDSNTISTTIGNDNLTLVANGTGKVLIPSNNVQIDQNLVVGQNLTVTTGSTSLQAVGITGTLTQTGNFTQSSGNFSTTGTINSGAITSTGTLTLPSVTIASSTITGTTTATNLTLTPYAGRQVEITSNAQLDGNATIGGTLGVTGISTLAAVGITGTLTQTGNFVQTGNFTTSGNASVTGNITGTGTLTLPTVTISSSTISGTASNTDLQLTANGTGRIYIPTNNVRVDNNLSVGGTFGVTGTSTLADVGITGTLTQTGNFVQTGNFTSSGDVTTSGNATISGIFTIPNITISGSTITTNTSNLDLTLTANGSGGVIVQGLKVSGTDISSTATNANITLTPNGTGNVVISGNQSLALPSGTISQRPQTPTNGMIRYNTELSRYEGYNATYSLWLAIGGVQDTDGNTYIKAESSPGANDNTLYFYINSVEKARLDATKLTTTRVQTTNLDIQNNTIGALTSNTDIVFTTSGTGGVKVGNLVIKDNGITNTVSGAVTEFAETGTGYVKITGTNGIVIPSGDTSQLPTNPEIGMVRFNTYYSYVEVYNGTTWTNAAGSTSGISISQAQDIGIVSALLFG
jgi:hypothetical protein